MRNQNSKAEGIRQSVPINIDLWKYAIPYRHDRQGIPKDGYLAVQYGAAILVMIILRIINSYFPVVLGTVIDHLSMQKVAWREIFVLGALRLTASKSGLQGIERALISRVSHSLHARFKAYCYGHSMDLSADFHLSKTVGEIVTAISSAATAMDGWLDLLFSALPLIADLIAALIAVGRLFPQHTIVTLLSTIAFFIALNALWVTYNFPKYQRTNARRRDLELHIINTLLCWKTVLECRKVGVEKQRHRTKSEKHREALQDSEDSALILDAGLELAATIGFLTACSYEVISIGKGYSKPTRLLTLLMYWSRATESTKSLGSMYAKAANTKQVTLKLQSMLQETPSMESQPESSAFQFMGGAVVLEDVTFSYDHKRDVLKSLSFEVQAGQKVALVGQTGSGKSTIFKLISRLFDPRSGSIIVDGQDIRHLALDSYRAVLGIVSQNTVLMNASIKENVAYPCLDASDEDVIFACKTAGIHETIMGLPKQYCEEVGELAGRLSGGEIQRLVLARLYVQDPRIVLLDEATSNLDGVTEKKTWELLDKFCQGRTTFVITHRLSTIRNADKIIVIDNGTVVEQGTHMELIANGESRYLASLRALQE